MFIYYEIVVKSSIDNVINFFFDALCFSQTVNPMEPSLLMKKKIPSKTCFLSFTHAHI